MIVVIQCAAKKRPDAGYLRSLDGRKVMFVANPGIAPASDDQVFARPDDPSDSDNSWRTALYKYNANPGNNPLGLLPAWQLYENSTYELLANHCGLEQLYILSAGWGLIRADFLTPFYDITFSSSADTYKRRREQDKYNDFRMLPNGIAEPIIFFGGKDYVSLFCTLSEGVERSRTIWYNSLSAPSAGGCEVQRFHTATRTNWHYECAKAFVAGSLRA